MEARQEEQPATKLAGARKADEPKKTSKACPMATTTPTTSDSATNSTTGTGATIGTEFIVYDVEHLATFSTTPTNATSHEGSQQQTPNNINNDAAQQVATGADNTSPTTPRVALRKLFELEKLSGIWTQRMQIELRDSLMLIVDCETNCVVEKFHRHCVSQPEAFNHYNDIYNNIVVFIIKQQQVSSRTDSENEAECSDEPTGGELHIFQCVSHKAQQLVDDIIQWKSSTTSNRPTTGSASSLVMSSSPSGASSSGTDKDSGSKPEEAQTTNPVPSQSSPSASCTSDNSPIEASKSAQSIPVLTVASSAKACDTVPLVNVNVKETVQVFNQIAALREKR